MPLLVVYLLVRAYWLVYDASGPALDPLWAQTGSVANVVAGAGPSLLVERILPAVAATGVGGLLFPWVFYRWGTLWPAIGLHAAVNFWWAVSGEGVFQATLTRPVVTPVALAQALSRALAIGVTIRWTGRPSA